VPLGSRARVLVRAKGPADVALVNCRRAAEEDATGYWAGLDFIMSGFAISRHEISST
jgi:hypothetical protein